MSKNGPDVVAFVGTAGVGKSCLFLYILIRWFSSNGGPQSFYYQLSKDDILFFEVTMDGQFKLSTVTSAGSTLYVGMPLFVDMEEQCLPKHHDGKVFIFSSFQPNRYKEITKEKVVYTVPVWSEGEYGAYMSYDHFWTDRGLDKVLHHELVESSIVVYGGGFRNVIMAVSRVVGMLATSIDWLVDDALTKKGNSVADSIFLNGFRVSDKDISDVLIHRNPPSSYGMMVYGATPVVHEVASHYIFQKLLKLQEGRYSNAMKMKFNGGVFGGGDDGVLFEHLSLNVFTIAEKSFDLAPLTNNNTACKIGIPGKAMLTPNWKTLQLHPNTLYVPSHGTLESGDAFCCLDQTVIVFQITIAELHPVKMQGLRVISDRFPNATRQCLVFVIPSNGKLKAPQKFHTTEGKVAQRFDGVDGFMQNQYKLENEFV